MEILIDVVIIIVSCFMLLFLLEEISISFISFQHTEFIGNIHGLSRLIESPKLKKNFHYSIYHVPHNSPETTHISIEQVILFREIRRKINYIFISFLV